MSRKILPKAVASPPSALGAKVVPHPAAPAPAPATRPPKVKFGGDKIPKPYMGIQVNVCKNPNCQNYGVWPTYRKRKGRTPIPPIVGDYAVVGKSAGFEKSLKCVLCCGTSTLRSNKAVYDEIVRISSYLDGPHAPVSCPNESCTEFGIVAKDNSGKQSLCGTTAAGTKRYRCMVCRKVYSVGRAPKNRGENNHKLRSLFSAVVNKAAARRAMEMVGMGSWSYYSSLEFLYKQCVAFSGNRERQLLTPSDTHPKRLYLAVDRQSYTLNWVTAENRQNVIMNAIASVDQDTRYAFGLTLNFDGQVDAKAVEAAAEAGDIHLPNAWRNEARLKLMVDYDRAAENSAARKQAKEDFIKAAELKEKEPELRLIAEVAETYVDTVIREDVENKALTEEYQQPPPYGMQVFDQYTLIAHFNVMRQLTANIEKVRVFADQDSGMRSAFLQAFSDRVKDRTAELFYVKIDKSLTSKGKLNAIAKTEKKILKHAAAHGMSAAEAQVDIMKEAIRAGTVTPPFDDIWVHHACPNKGEPYKQVAWLTPHTDFDEDHVARLFLRASLGPVDALFNIVRRRLGAAERSFVTPSSKRTWDAYFLYNPHNLVMLLEILRTFHNYCKATGDDDEDGGGEGGKKKKGKGRKVPKFTPAQRMGLAKGVVDLHDIIYYKPAHPADQRLRRRKRPT